MPDLQFSIITPTFNRAYTLPKLYRSLTQQSFTDFEWIVIDDGSTDNTQELIESFIKEGKLDISYTKTENCGKPRAVNFGSRKCRGTLLLVVDSDDWLTENALELLHDKWEEIKCDDSVAGMIALRGYPDGQVVGTRMPKGIKRTNVWDLYNKHHFDGDAIHIYRTNVFIKYPAPVAEGEKFISESYVFNKIAQTYDVLLVDEVIYVGDYLPDGLSAHVRKLARDNPVGYYTSKSFDVELSHTAVLRCRNTMLYLVGCFLAKRPIKQSISMAPNRYMALLTLIPAWLLSQTVFRFGK